MLKTKQAIYLQYIKAGTEKLEAAKDHLLTRDELKAVSFLYVKGMGLVEKKEASYQIRFGLAEITIKLLSFLTPAEFIEIFPIEKYYDGWKFDLKDYYYTQGFMSALDEKIPIGIKIDELLGEYQNATIRRFYSGYLIAMREIWANVKHDVQSFEQQSVSIVDAQERSIGRTFKDHEIQRQAVFVSKVGAISDTLLQVIQPQTTIEAIINEDQAISTYEKSSMLRPITKEGDELNGK